MLSLSVKPSTLVLMVLLMYNTNVPILLLLQSALLLVGVCCCVLVAVGRNVIYTVLSIVTDILRETTWAADVHSVIQSGEQRWR